MTSYNTIFKRFEMKIESLEPIKLGGDGWNEMCVEWLNSAVGMIELDSLKIEHSLKKDDETMVFDEDLTNGEIEVLSLYMVVAWYDSQINSLEHVNMFYGSKDEKWTSQKEHANYILATQEKYRKRARKYFRNHSTRNNSYINGDES